MSVVMDKIYAIMGRHEMFPFEEQSVKRGVEKV